MEVLEIIAVLVFALLIMLGLVSFGLTLCRTFGVWPGGLEQDLADDGDSDDDGETDVGGDSSGWDFGDWLDGLL